MCCWFPVNSVGEDAIIAYIHGQKNDIVARCITGCGGGSPSDWRTFGVLTRRRRDSARISFERYAERYREHRQEDTQASEND